jgi:hypothetical protein
MFSVESLAKALAEALDSDLRYKELLGHWALGVGSTEAVSMFVALAILERSHF